MTPPSHNMLKAELHTCIAEMQALTGLTIELTVDIPETLPLTPLAQQQALHIVREALTNVWRHAGVQRASVHVEQVDDVVRLLIRDEGCGFDPMAVDESTHLGLTIMRARAERSDGTLDILSRLDAGTTIIATFPLNKEQGNEPLAIAVG